KRRLLEEIGRMHDHFVELMNERLEEVEASDLERYFAFMSNLVTKLEQRDKTLRDAAREMVAESASWVMAELSRG
ncbi:MAG: hypothetical protein D6760_08765, partial [Deltaproteobacteria bacterium]